MKLTILGTGNAMVTRCYNTCFALGEGEDFLLVEPSDGSWIRASADRIQVPVEDADAFRPGFAVTVTFSGEILETYPAQITDVVSVTLSEKEN